MATIGTNLTLLDHAKRLDPDGKLAKIVEMLSQTNELLQDVPYLEANGVGDHQVTIRAGLPTVYWRLMNQGVLNSKSVTAQVKEGIGMLEAWSEVDCALAKLGGDPAGFRLSEAMPFVEAMGQELAQTYFYGAASVAEEFVGLNARYSSTSANNGSNVISGSGAGSDNSSIWLIVWGENTVHGIYPKGSQAGLLHEDLGEETAENVGGVTGAKMRVYRDRFALSAGLVVKDWRYAVRICNIDISNLVAESSAADLVKLMIKAYHRIPSFGAGKAAFYVNRTVHQMLDIQSRNDVISGGGLGFGNYAGQDVLMFRGIPVRRSDALTETEATVS